MNVFGRSRLDSAGTLELLYTCPVLAEVDSHGAGDTVARVQDLPVQTQVTSIVVCNYDTTTSIEYSIHYTDSSADTQADEEFRLFYLVTLTAETTHILNPGIVMSAGNEIWVLSSIATTSFIMNYIEIS